MTPEIKIIPEYNKEDAIISVQLPYKDYKVMRELIEERQAMNGVKKWLTSNVFWLCGGVLSVLGLIGYFKGWAN